MRAASSPDFDLLRVPLLGRFLRWRHARAAMQAPMLIAAALLIFDGFVGAQLAPENLAGVAPWIQWRGLTVLALLLVGSLACMVCPFMLPRWLAKRLLPARRSWPRRLQGKWLAALLLALFFWFYEAFAPWASPRLTALVTLAYFAGAFLVDGFFKGAAFCRYLCPIGQFNFVNSLVSPTELRVRSIEGCAACATKGCIRRPDGCELGLFQERKVGNMDCTFCLDCVHACPHDNVGLIYRTPAAELWDGRRRSGVGRLVERTDLAALVLVMVFGAMMNAFGMVAPFVGFEERAASLLRTDSPPLVLLAIFGAGLGLLPLLLVGLAAFASRALSGSREALRQVATRQAFGLVPLGFGMWLAHYGFHFLTGGLTLVPVGQSFLSDAGLPWLGEPRWGLAPLVPASWLLPMELLFLEGGLLLSLVAGYRLAQTAYRPVTAGGRAARPMLAGSPGGSPAPTVPAPASVMGAYLPWAILTLALFAADAWLLMQPMQMRGTFS